MKRIISVILVTVICLLALAGCGSANQNDTSSGASAAANTGGTAEPEAKIAEPCTVAIAVSTYNAQMLKAQKYFNDYLSKELNVKFIFSEELGNDVDSVLTFIENAYAAGAKGVMDYAINSLVDFIPIAEKCEELGLYFTSWNYGAVEAMADMKYAVGLASSDDANINELFVEMINEVLSDGEKHNLVLATAGAHFGSEQQIRASIGVLETYRDMYGLTYSDDIENLVMLDSITEIETGVDDVKITIFPKFSGDELNSVLKNGDYDVVAVVANLYLRFESTIKEIEEAYNMDIKLIVQTEISDSTYNSFNTLDPTGKQSLDAAMLSTSGKMTIALALVLNGIYGDIDAVLIDGKPAAYNSQAWLCYASEDYEIINTIDTSVDTYIFDINEFKQMLKFYNEELTGESLMNYAQEYSGMESVFMRKGLN